MMELNGNVAAGIFVFLFTLGALAILWAFRPSNEIPNQRLGREHVRKWNESKMLTAHQNLVISDLFIRKVLEHPMNRCEIEETLVDLISICKKVNEETNIDALSKISQSYLVPKEKA